MSKEEKSIESAVYITMGAVVICSLPAIITYQVAKKLAESVSETVQFLISSDTLFD